MGGDDRLPNPHHPALEAIAAAALRGRASPLDHQKKLLGKQFRLVQSRRLAEPGQSFALAALESFDHRSAGMTSFGQFDGRICKEAPALLAPGEFGGHTAEPAIEPRPGVGLARFQSVPERIGPFGKPP